MSASADNDHICRPLPDDLSRRPGRKARTPSPVRIGALLSVSPPPPDPARRSAVAGRQVLLNRTYLMTSQLGGRNGKNLRMLGLSDNSTAYGPDPVSLDHSIAAQQRPGEASILSCGRRWPARLLMTAVSDRRAGQIAGEETARAAAGERDEKAVRSVSDIRRPSSRSQMARPLPEGRYRFGGAGTPSRAMPAVTSLRSTGPHVVGNPGESNVVNDQLYKG